MKRAPHWLRARMGVRVVSALAAAAAVAVVLAVAGVSLVFLLDHQLRQSTESSAESQAEVLGQRIAANFTGSGDAKANSIDATGKRGDIVQVLTDYGDDSDDPDSRVGSNGPQSDVQVIGSSDTLDSEPRMVDWLLAPRETRVVPSAEVTLADGSTEEVTIVGKGYRATGRPITVLAAQPLKPVHQAVDTVSVMVSIGIPILVVITGFFTYLFAGRALRPVEAMRRRVAGLTDRDLDRRVPEPHAQDEVGRLARTMNQMLSRLQDSQATQRRFVADASHELRSPLATVSTGLELLGNGMGEDSADLATVQTLRGETGRLTKLVEGLLFLARADERGLAPRREEVDLDELVEGERVRPSADGRISVTVSTEPVRVVGDRSQLVRVLRNLVDNARRYARDDGVGLAAPRGRPGRDRRRRRRLRRPRGRPDPRVRALRPARRGPGTQRRRVRSRARDRLRAGLGARRDGVGGRVRDARRRAVPGHGAAVRSPGSLDPAEPSSGDAEAPGADHEPSGRPGPARPVEVPGQVDRGAAVTGAAVTDGAVTGAAVTDGAVTGGAPPAVPAGAEPVLFDDRPSGPLPRVPMGGRRRGPVAEPAVMESGDDAVAQPADTPAEPAADAPVEVGAGATAGSPANGTPPGPRAAPGPRPSAAAEPRHRSAHRAVADPPEHGRQPADENATRPLPQVRPAGAGRAGTAVAPARNAGTNGTARNAGTNGTAHNGVPARNGHANGGPGARNGAGANGHSVRRPDGRPQNGHPRNGSNGSPPPGRPSDS